MTRKTITVDMVSAFQQAIKKELKEFVGMPNTPETRAQMLKKLLGEPVAFSVERCNEVRKQMDRLVAIFREMNPGLRPTLAFLLPGDFEAVAGTARSLEVEGVVWRSTGEYELRPLVECISGVPCSTAMS